MENCKKNYNEKVIFQLFDEDGTLVFHTEDREEMMDYIRNNSEIEDSIKFDYCEVLFDFENNKWKDNGVEYFFDFWCKEIRYLYAGETSQRGTWTVKAVEEL